jgi:hypothetical protein
MDVLDEILGEKAREKKTRNPIGFLDHERNAKLSAIVLHRTMVNMKRARERQIIGELIDAEYSKIKTDIKDCLP